MESRHFDPTNAEHIIYQYGLLDIAVLGGIRLEGLDRMRATLKVGLKDSNEVPPPVRHNLDLYNDLAVEKLIRRIAERLEVGTSLIAAALSDLIGCLEQHRLEEKERQEATQEPQKKMLSPEEIKEAKLYGSSPNLMQRTGDDLQATGIVGEWKNALILKVVMISRLCNDPLSAICLAKSGIGKSYLLERVAATLPKESILASTMISESSFYRFGRRDLVGKVFIFEDLDGALSALYPIREMQTKKEITKLIAHKDPKTGQFKTTWLIVEGPVSVCGATTRESVYEDNANRCILIHLDNSREQDKRIMDYLKKVKAGLIDLEAEEQTREQLRNLQRILLPIRIINPYAPYIDLPDEVFIPRRTLGLLLSFIDAITFYHQHQRENQYDQETGEEYIETTPEDIEWAFDLLRDTLFRKSDELTGACREFYEQLKAWAAKNKVDKFYASDIRQDKRIHPRTLNRHLQELKDYGRLQVTGGNKHKTGYQYEIIQGADYQSLQDKIDQQISKVLEKVKKAHASREQEKQKPKGKKQTGK